MKCRSCGQETGYRRVCYTCMKKWKEKRTQAFNQAVSEIGPLNAQNLKSIQKRIHQIEKQHNNPIQPTKNGG